MPLQTEVLAPHVIKTMPVIQQVFVTFDDDTHLDRRLYLVRKQIEAYCAAERLDVYFTSLSHKTIVYKGWLRSDQIKGLYTDLNAPDYTSKLGLVHSRFSTNTIPSWQRAHPNRMLMHNGEINTIKGNVNWMRAREQRFIQTVFGQDAQKIQRIVDESGSDSAIVDNALEFLSLSMEPEKAAMLLIPEPWLYHTQNDPAVRAFYEYYSYAMEPWDGPTMIAFCNGDKIGALTDRNGLRPGRYTVTHDNEIIFASETGVVDVPESEVRYKGQLNPGKLLLVDFATQAIIDNDTLKTRIANEQPYATWLSDANRTVDVSSVVFEEKLWDADQLHRLQQRFVYTKEELDKYLTPLVAEQKDPIGAMGYDAPLAVLNDVPQSLFHYFKQLFAQVTNPPMDAYREKIVTSPLAYLGREGNVLQPDETLVQRIPLPHPILHDGQCEIIASQSQHKVATLSTVYDGDLASALEKLAVSAIAEVKNGSDILILDDSALLENDGYAMPALLALSHVHQQLIQQHLRMDTSLIVKTGEAREVHHMACLIGYGANAVVPYVAQQTIASLVKNGRLSGAIADNVARYNQTLAEGVIKVMAKMGISTVQSYHGAQIFEAIGLSDDVIEHYFPGTQSKLSGIPIEVIDRENKARQTMIDGPLDSGSTFQWRQQGQRHAFNPTTIFQLQHACRDNDYDAYKAYASAVHETRTDHLRQLLTFKKRTPVAIDQVEPASAIVKRFSTGAMSYGSISKEAHETLAEAMNHIGGQSNSGEGGEDPTRYTPGEHGENYMSAIKQVASGRFGVTSDYLQHAKEIQIKVAQGAKPGEGGQLPGGKVYPWIAEVRGSTPGIGLISPPPHHDIYSIEDLAQLIHDLKNANPDADIAVKLVSKTGVGTIAAGVAKAFADKIVISGYDGGTGASPKTSIQHAGVPWEIGLAETHQTLMMNGLRSRVKLETDGKLLTGKDVAYACALGAEAFAFATAPLVVLGCIMMRVCHNDTCPVGIATQNEDLRTLYRGRAEHVRNFMYFVAEELREILAELGLTTVDELVGRTELLMPTTAAVTNEKVKHIDIERLLYQYEGPRYQETKQNHRLVEGFDMNALYADAQKAITEGRRFEGRYTLVNTQRDVGVMTGSMITRQHGADGMPEDFIIARTTGHAGQSLGAFIPKGLTLDHTGDANDYVGKGLSGGKIIVRAPQLARASEIIVGNVCFYGATRGAAYIEGKAGERFCIRNSGAQVVVEGVGDHALEYMTGGRVVILGDVGKNFAQGMSGGICYVLPTDVAQFKAQHQRDDLLFECIDADGCKVIHDMLTKHVSYTSSKKAQHILENFDAYIPQMVRVIPKAYKLMMQKIAVHRTQETSEAAALLQAFNDTRTQLPDDVKRVAVY